MTAALILFGVSAAVAQSAVTGKIVDETGAPLIGASVTVPGTSQGVSTDVDGNFTLKTDAKEIEISYVGYVPTKKPVTGPNARLGIIQMEPDAVALQDVIVMQSVAVQRKTPVAVSTVNAEEISYKLGGQEFPEILKSTPGVYVTKDGGGFGDSKINMRGFQAANVAVMVNGVPVNDMEWGGVYWSNWAGLSDVTRSMQTQRGLGASKISSPSVGGSVNIVTNGIEAKQGGTFSFGVGNDGLYSLSFSLSTGLTKSGWALSVLGAKRWGDGYIQGTNFEGYNWFVNISKRINDRHQLSLTAFGAPQKHAQRHALDDGLKIEEWQKAKNFMGEKDMYRYNAEYGFDKNGRQRYSHFNEYHKPQISLNHQWQIDYKSSLSTALYMSIGRGSGYSGQGRTSADRNMWKGTNYGVLNTTFRNPDGTFAYDKIQEMNAASPDGSRMIMSKSNNNHMWYGLLSTYTNQISKSLELSAGIDVRYYIGEHNNEIIDLYDGKYDKNKAQIDKDYRFSFKCKNTERVGVFADNNQMYMIKVADIIKLQAKKNTGKKGNGSGLIGRLSDKGIQIFEFCNMNGNENILYMCCIEQIIDKNLLFVTKHGQAKLVPGNNYDVLRKMIAASKQEEDIIFIHDAEMEDFIVVKSMLGYYARIQISEIPVKGKGAGCIRLVNITDDDEIEEVAVGSTKDSFFVDNTEILFTRIKACKRGSKGTKLRL